MNYEALKSNYRASETTQKVKLYGFIQEQQKTATLIQETDLQILIEKMKEMDCYAMSINLFLFSSDMQIIKTQIAGFFMLLFTIKSVKHECRC